MSFNEAACCFDASMYTGVPDAEPCAQSLDTKSIIAGLDKLLFSGDDAAAGEYLDRWCQKAQEAGDWRTELTLQSELMGFHRRTSDKAAAMAAVERGLELIREHRLGSTVSGATIILNAATTLKAYGMAVQSIPMFVQTCRVYSQTLDPLDYRFGGLYNNMALSYADIGDAQIPVAGKGRGNGGGHIAGCHSLTGECRGNEVNMVFLQKLDTVGHSEIVIDLVKVDDQRVEPLCG